MYILSISNNSNISKQSFINIFTSDVCTQEVISFLKYIEKNNPYDFEPQICLLVDIYINLITSNINNSKVNNFIIIYGNLIYITFEKLLAKIHVTYNKEKNEIINTTNNTVENIGDNKINVEINNESSSIIDNLESIKDPYTINYFNKIEAFLNMLKPCNELSYSKNSISPIMEQLNKSCFLSVEQYNLNDKLISVEKFKEEVREDIRSMKMNIVNYNAKDPFFLGDIENKNSLINNTLITLRIINYTVKFFNYI